MSVRGAWQLPRLRCERCSISRSNCGRSASRLALGEPATGKVGDAAGAKFGAAAKGIDPKAERLEQPFVAPRQGFDRAGIDLLGRRPVMHDRRSSLLPLVPARGIFTVIITSVPQDPSRMRSMRVIPCASRNCVPGMTPDRSGGPSRRAPDFFCRSKVALSKSSQKANKTLICVRHMNKVSLYALWINLVIISRT